MFPFGAKNAVFADVRDLTGVSIATWFIHGRELRCFLLPDLFTHVRRVKCASDLASRVHDALSHWLVVFGLFMDRSLLILKVKKVPYRKSQDDRETSTWIGTRDRFRRRQPLDFRLWITGLEAWFSLWALRRWLCQRLRETVLAGQYLASWQSRESETNFASNQL